MSTDLSKRDQAESASTPASDGQVEKLTEAIVRSQHNYRELIDNLDQALFTISLQGEVRVANLRLSEILGASFQDLIGRPLSEFIESPIMAEAQRGLPALLKTGMWSGTIPVWLKKDKTPRYFDCWLQTAVEGEVKSIIGWARDVTKERESEIRFKELFDSFSEGIFFVTPSGQLLDANPAFIRILGYNSKEELQAINFRDLYDEPSARDAILRELEAKGAVHEREIVMRRKDGKRIHCLTSGFAMRDASGRSVRAQGTLVDITERKEMEKRLEQEQGFTRRLVANFPDLIAVLDREGRFIYISDHVEKALGWRPDAYVGRMFGTHANEEDKKKLHEMFQRIVRGEESRGQVEFRSPHADGSSRVLLLSASPFFDEDGKISGLVTSARDVTERYDMERKLHQEQEFVRSLVECFPDLIVVLDSEGRFKFVSDRVKDILGVSAKDYVGKPIGQRIDAEGRSKLAEMFQNVISGLSAQDQIEIRAQHVDGTWKIIRVTASPLFDEKGKIVGMVSSGRDVTDSKQLEQQLAEKEKFAAMGQMMAGAAHELNNPLTAILGVSDLLRERATDDSTRRQVDLILQQARRAAAIVQNLLAFSRPSSQGRTKLHLEELVKEALQLEQANLEKKNISVRFAAPADLPPLEGDRKLILQVFLNVIANAEQSISPAHEQGVLDISMTHVGDKIRVTFADDGPGILPEIIGKVFDPFFTTKRPGGGSGLGLTICLAVVKEHGGTIEIESKPGTGAKVHVNLPAAAEFRTPQPHPVPTAKSAAASASPSALQGHTVLIVDDEEGIREIVQEGLAARGMEVQTAASSEAALAHLAKNTCEIVLCDFNLPGMSGEKLFEALRARLGASLPRFVFMTGELVDPAVMERCSEKRARVFQKPFQISALATLLTEILQPQPSPAK